FAVNLRQCVDLLPRLLGSLVEAMRFLGPEHCALSIVEGNSDDGTLETLQLLTGELQAMGVEYWLASSTLDPSAGLRIRKLAKLRAMALEPTADEIGTTTYFARPVAIHRLPLAPNAIITFINDVSACAEDILELVHQRIFQAADMVCAMDWTNPNPNPKTPSPPLHPRSPIFYDIWITRSLTGNLLFNLLLNLPNPQTLFFDHPAAQSRFTLGQPTQVFSCWNGAAALAAAPFASGEVSFLWPRVGECYQGEVQLLCKNLWRAGRGRIAVAPRVSLGYSDSDGVGRWVKRERGYVSDFVGRSRRERIVWEEEPPARVKCVSEFEQDWWLSWNESLL
ncbi:glycosyltransferase family 69 protein, partial [Parathielavia hyrcaniae]